MVRKLIVITQILLFVSCTSKPTDGHKESLLGNPNRPEEIVSVGLKHYMNNQCHELAAEYIEMLIKSGNPISALYRLKDLQITFPNSRTFDSLYFEAAFLGHSYNNILDTTNRRFPQYKMDTRLYKRIEQMTQ